MARASWERRCLVSHIEFEEGEILAALTKRGAQLVEAPGRCDDAVTSFKLRFDDACACGASLPLIVRLS
jgi:hypothetical protein